MIDASANQAEHHGSTCGDALLDPYQHIGNLRLSLEVGPLNFDGDVGARRPLGHAPGDLVPAARPHAGVQSLWSAALAVEQFGPGLEQLPAVGFANRGDAMERQPDGIQGTQKSTQQIEFTLAIGLDFMASCYLDDGLRKGW